MQKSPPDTWVRCTNCGHKLLRIIDVGKTTIELKCHSCKAINEINLHNYKEAK